MGILEEAIDRVNNRTVKVKMAPFDITKLVPSDIGRGVVYRPSAGPLEYGILSSWRGNVAFVRYTSGVTASGTDPKDLSFTGDKDDKW